jgi:hypothetical protein
MGARRGDSGRTGGRSRTDRGVGVARPAHFNHRPGSSSCSRRGLEQRCRYHQTITRLHGAANVHPSQMMPCITAAVDRPVRWRLPGGCTSVNAQAQQWHEISAERVQTSLANRDANRLAGVAPRRDGYDLDSYLWLGRPRAGQRRRGTTSGQRERQCRSMRRSFGARVGRVRSG